MKKYLISYGDSKYISQREFLRETAAASLFFDEIRIFTPEDLDHQFEEHMRGIVGSGKGGGYWVWKPYFIKKMIDSIETGDILIYCDAGCLINPAGGDRFKEYIDLLISSETGSLDFELTFKEYQYTKQEVFDYFESTEYIINSNQLMATVILLQKQAHAIMLVDKWYNTVWENITLFTDQRGVPQHEGFIDHRHDQSVFSVIRKTYGANTIPDETYFLDFIKDGVKLPFWATRLRG